MSKYYFCSSLNTIQKDKWNKCIGDDHPFLQYEFLIALEKRDRPGQGGFARTVPNTPF